MTNQGSRNAVMGAVSVLDEMQQAYKAGNPGKVKEVSARLGEQRDVLAEHLEDVPPMLKSFKHARFSKLVDNLLELGNAWLAANKPKPKVAKKKSSKAKPPAPPAPPVTEDETEDEQSDGDGRGLSARKIGNAVKKLSRERRHELYAELHDGNTPPRGATVRQVTGAIAAALVGRELPDDVNAKVSRRRASGEKAPKRIDTIVECVTSPGGATLDDIAAMLLERYPNLSGRWQGKPATHDAYRRYARTAMWHLNSGKTMAVAAQFEGLVRKTEGKPVRYYIEGVTDMSAVPESEEAAA